jgi:uncharacterized protein (DUF488 family)
MTMDYAPGTIFTIGHSNHPLDKFIEMLHAYNIDLLADIRSAPSSRYCPQYNKDAMQASLPAAGIKYTHLARLGGHRPRCCDNSPNTGWRNGGFRAYADYMQTAEFQSALDELIELGRSHRVAIMCAESVPWRCHRSLVSDALVIRDVPVIEIFSKTNAKPRKLTSFAHVDGVELTYPSTQLKLV